LFEYLARLNKQNFRLLWGLVPVLVFANVMVWDIDLLPSADSPRREIVTATDVAGVESTPAPKATTKMGPAPKATHKPKRKRSASASPSASASASPSTTPSPAPAKSESPTTQPTNKPKPTPTETTTSPNPVENPEPGDGGTDDGTEPITLPVDPVTIIEKITN
jgi:hypothetical protein